MEHNSRGKEDAAPPMTNRLPLANGSLVAMMDQATRNNNDNRDTREVRRHDKFIYAFPTKRKQDANKTLLWCLQSKQLFARLIQRSTSA